MCGLREGAYDVLQFFLKSHIFFDCDARRGVPSACAWLAVRLILAHVDGGRGGLLERDHHDELRDLLFTFGGLSATRSVLEKFIGMPAFTATLVLIATSTPG